MARTSKVLVDVKGTNNLLYLPLDRLLKSGEAAEGGGARPGGAAAEPVPATSTTADDNAAASRLRDLNRSREVR